MKTMSVTCGNLEENLLFHCEVGGNMNVILYTR